jgi:hypothetical protein
MIRVCIIKTIKVYRDEIVERYKIHPMITCYRSEHEGIPQSDDEFTEIRYLDLEKEDIIFVLNHKCKDESLEYLWYKAYTPEEAMRRRENNLNVYRNSIAFDLDNTITLHGETYKDITGINEFIKNLIIKCKNAGKRVVIFTLRCCYDWSNCIEYEEKEVKSILDKYEIPYDEIWTRPGKPACKLTVDDSVVNTYDPVLEQRINEFIEGKL